MCFNATTSLVTFSISLFCFVYLLYFGLKKKDKNEIFVAVLTIVIGLMQLIEFFLWRNQTCNRINHYLSLLVILLLFLQVVVMNILYIVLYPGKKVFFSDNFVILYLLVYFIFIIYVLNYLNKQYLCSRPTGHNCRLVWDGMAKMNNNFTMVVLFSLFYFSGMFIILLNSLWSNDLITRYPLRYNFLFVTILIAFIYIFIKNNLGKKNTSIFKNIRKLFTITSEDAFGSVWCFLCVFIGIVGILKL
jgi:hypothetical protein